jgi:MFS family permease
VIAIILTYPPMAGSADMFTTSPVNALATPALASRAGARFRLATAIGSHTVVDFFSFIIVPLLSVFEGRVHMSPAQGAVILAAGSVSSGLIQPLVAWLSDRFDTRWLGTLAFLVAVIAVGSVGFVTSFPQLLLLQVIAAAGIGAYHPVAAAATGQLSAPFRGGRATGLALFYAAGMVGGVAGNLTAPAWTRHFGHGEAAAGVPAIAWFIPPGLVCVVLLAIAIHAIPHRHHAAHAEHAALPREQRLARWRSIWLLYFGNVLRFLTDMCLIQLIVRWGDEQAAAGAGVLPAGMGGSPQIFSDVLQQLLTPELRTRSAEINGFLQAARQVGMGAGGLALLLFLRGRSERTVLTLVPILGAFVIVATPFTSGWAAILLCALAGLGYGGVIPTTLSMAQRLLPHRTSLASGLMLGGAWCMASVGPPLVQWLYASYGLRTSFAVVAVMLFASGLIGLFLPKLAAPSARST